MTRVLFLCLCIAMAACGGQGQGDEKEVVQNPDSAVNKPVDDSTTHVAIKETDPLGDDSVFTDGSVPASWENAGFTDPVAFKQFLLRLRSWTANGQKDSVANVISYPLRNPKVANRQQFLQQYDTLFNGKVKAALQQQNLRQIFRRDQGAMIGNGELWFRQAGNNYQIIGINNK